MSRSLPPIRRALVLIAGLVLAGAGTVAARIPATAGPKPVEVQLLALNDFHGNLEPPGGSGGAINGVPAGGAEYLATHLDLLAEEVKKHNTITVAAGEGVKIGFIGLTLEGTPQIVTQAGVAGLTFTDEIETANRYAAELQAQGVESIVVLVHEGGAQASGGINDCNGLTGPIVDIANGFSDAIDVVVSGHTHQAYNCVIDDKIVTSASSSGRLVTDIDLQIDRRTGDVLSATDENIVVTRTVDKDPEQTALIARYRTLLGPIASQQVGVTSAPITRTQEILYGTVPTRRGVSPRWATSSPTPSSRPPTTSKEPWPPS